jgi:hypothetical protein
LRQPQPLFLIHHRNLTTSSRSRPTTSNYHASTGFARKLFGDGHKSISSDSNSSQSTPSSPSERQLEPTAFPIKSILYRNPFPDDVSIEAVKQHMSRKLAENDPEFLASLRQIAFETPYDIFQTNFPQEDGFMYSSPGPAPQDINYADETGGEEKVATIPRDDTRLYLVGKKQGGTVCVALCALPPAGVGEPEFSGTPLARETIDTPAMDVAGKSLLDSIRLLQDVGYVEYPPLGDHVVHGCMGMVIMGGGVSISEYSKARGLYDPPGGVEFEMKKVDEGPELPWPALRL